MIRQILNHNVRLTLLNSLENQSSETHVGFQFDTKETHLVLPQTPTKILGNNNATSPSVSIPPSPIGSPSRINWQPVDKILLLKRLSKHYLSFRKSKAYIKIKSSIWLSIYNESPDSYNTFVNFSKSEEAHDPLKTNQLREAAIKEALRSAFHSLERSKKKRTQELQDAWDEFLKLVESNPNFNN